jgi:hypothetical protein
VPPLLPQARRHRAQPLLPQASRHRAPPHLPQARRDRAPPPATDLLAAVGAGSWPPNPFQIPLSWPPIIPPKSPHPPNRLDMNPLRPPSSSSRQRKARVRPPLYPPDLLRPPVVPPPLLMDSVRPPLIPLP